MAGPWSHPGPQHPKVDPDKPTGAGADQELGVAFEKLDISPPSTQQPGPPKVLPLRSPSGASPKPGTANPFANPFAALLPRAPEPGPPSERTQQMRKDLEKTLL